MKEVMRHVANTAKQEANYVRFMITLDAVDLAERAHFQLVKSNYVVKDHIAEAKHRVKMGMYKLMEN